MEPEIEQFIEQFLADFEAVNFDGYRRFFAGPRLILIMPGVGVMRGLDAYLEYESNSTKRAGRNVSWQDRSIEITGNGARVMGLLTMTFTQGETKKAMREFVTFLLDRDGEGQWRCFHLQATLATWLPQEVG
jgi:ketosteroid isomerase-like protein